MQRNLADLLHNRFKRNISIRSLNISPMAQRLRSGSRWCSKASDSLRRHEVSTRSQFPPGPHTTTGPWHKEFTALMIFSKQSAHGHINNRSRNKRPKPRIPVLIRLPDKTYNHGLEETRFKGPVSKRSHSQREENSASHQPHLGLNRVRDCGKEIFWRTLWGREEQDQKQTGINRM